MWRQELLAFAKREFRHPAWGDPHSDRVYRSALSLGAPQPLDDDVLFAAAYVHDAGAFPAFRADGVDHAERSVQVAPAILESVGFPPGKTGHVLEVVRGHMFYGTAGPSLESAVFHDADVLDFMGAIGVARVFSIVGIDDWTPDAGSAAALLRRFCDELPDALLTRSGKALGRSRAREMSAFLENLQSQTLSLEAL